MTTRSWPLFLSAGFRFYFLAASVFAVLAMGLWLAWLALAVPVPGGGAMPPGQWHGHEMIFGYALAVVSGFFLTAVPGWGGDFRPRQTFIAATGALWLAGRLAMLAMGHLPAGLVALADLAFLPVMTQGLARSLARNPKSLNIVFLMLLIFLIAANLMFHAEALGFITGFAPQALRLGLFSVLAMVALLGGRVVPAFTRNALLRRDGDAHLPVLRPRLDQAGVFAAMAVAAALGLGLPAMITGGLAALACALNAVRLSGWRGGRTLHDPLLWVLHLGFLFMVLAQGALAVQMVAGQGDDLAVVHLAGIGAIGIMTLAMMSRASLGHTGRALKAPPPVALAYGLVALAAVLRALGPLLAPAHAPGEILLSGFMWLAGFSLFLWRYLPILAGPEAPRPPLHPVNN